jgi:hypothetical protein
MISLGSLRIAGWVLLFSEMNTGSRTICILMNSASAHTIRVKAQDIMPISPLFALPNVLQEISTGTQVSNYIIIVDAPATPTPISDTMAAKLEEQEEEGEIPEDDEVPAEGLSLSKALDAVKEQEIELGPQPGVVSGDGDATMMSSGDTSETEPNEAMNINTPSVPVAA